MNLLQLFGAAKRALDAANSASSATDEGALAVRALGNALATTGFPIGPVYGIWHRVGPGDPLRLLNEIKAHPDVRQWVVEWSGVTGRVGPSAARVPATKPRRAQHR